VGMMIERVASNQAFSLDWRDLEAIDVLSFFETPDPKPEFARIRSVRLKTSAFPRFRAGRPAAG